MVVRVQVQRKIQMHCTGGRTALEAGRKAG